MGGGGLEHFLCLELQVTWASLECLVGCERAGGGGRLSDAGSGPAPLLPAEGRGGPGARLGLRGFPGPAQPGWRRCPPLPPAGPPRPLPPTPRELRSRLGGGGGGTRRGALGLRCKGRRAAGGVRWERGRRERGGSGPAENREKVVKSESQKHSEKRKEGKKKKSLQMSEEAQ